MDAIVAQLFMRPGMIARLLGIFVLLVLIMSMMGIYMLVAYLTLRCFKEIVVRRVMGVITLDILALLAVPTVGWTIAGLAAGLAGVMAAAGTLRAIVLCIVEIELTTVAL